MKPDRQRRDRLSWVLKSRERRSSDRRSRIGRDQAEVVRHHRTFQLHAVRRHELALSFARARARSRGRMLVVVGSIGDRIALGDFVVVIVETSEILYIGVGMVIPAASRCVCRFARDVSCFVGRRMHVMPATTQQGMQGRNGGDEVRNEATHDEISVRMSLRTISTIGYAVKRRRRFASHPVLYHPILYHSAHGTRETQRRRRPRAHLSRTPRT